MGIQYDYSENSPAAIVLSKYLWNYVLKFFNRNFFYIDQAHCFDLESINSKDSEEVVAVKQRIKQFVRNLLK